MAPKSTGTLIYQWTADNKEEFRLIALGRLTVGYEDAYLIERRELDGLGDMRWVPYEQWVADSEAKTSTLLVGALKAALRAQTLVSSKPAPEPGIRLLELIKHVTASNDIASALTIEGWHELQHGLSIHFRTRI